MLDEEIKQQYLKMRGGDKTPEIIGDVPKEPIKKKSFKYSPLLRNNIHWQPWEIQFIRRNRHRKPKLLARHLFRTQRMIIEKIRETKKYDKQIRNKKFSKP